MIDFSGDLVNPLYIIEIWRMSQLLRVPWFGDGDVGASLGKDAILQLEAVKHAKKFNLRQW
jgi:hypothetical protein